MASTDSAAVLAAKRKAMDEKASQGAPVNQRKPKGGSIWVE